MAAISSETPEGDPCPAPTSIYNQHFISSALISFFFPFLSSLINSCRSPLVYCTREQRGAPVTLPDLLAAHHLLEHGEFTNYCGNSIGQPGHVLAANYHGLVRSSGVLVTSLGRHSSLAGPERPCIRYIYEPGYLLPAIGSDAVVGAAEGSIFELRSNHSPYHLHSWPNHLSPSIYHGYHQRARL
jgi:hypothetical protein